MASYPFFPDVPDLPGVPALPRFPSSLPQAASFAASITGNLMSVTGVAQGLLYAGSRLAGQGLIDGTRVVQQLSGPVGTTGQYLVDVAQDFSGDAEGVFEPPSLEDDDGFLTADAPAALQPTTSTQWGIFDSSGAPVVVADNVVTVEARQEWAISNYPLEGGAFESYDKVYIPFDARVRFSRGGSEQRRQELIDSIDAIAGDLKFYDVVTPEHVWESANIIHQSISRAAKDGLGLVKMDVWLEQVKADATAEFSTAQTPSGAAPIKSPKDPNATSKKNDGQLQLAPPSAAQSAPFFDATQALRPAPRLL